MKAFIFLVLFRLLVQVASQSAALPKVPLKQGAISTDCGPNNFTIYVGTTAASFSGLSTGSTSLTTLSKTVLNTVPISNTSMYTAIGDLSGFNSMTTSFQGYFKNGSQVLAAFITSLNAAAANTTATSNFNNLQVSIDNALTFFTQDISTTVPPYKLADLQAFQANVAQFLTNFKGAIGQFQNLPTRANVPTSDFLTFVLGSSVVTGIVTQINDIATSFSSQYAATNAYMNNTITLFRSVDAQLALVESARNATANNINATLNSALLSNTYMFGNISANLTNSFNRTFNQFSLTVKSNSNVTKFNDDMKILLSGFNSTLAGMRDDIAADITYFAGNITATSNDATAFVLNATNGPRFQSLNDSWNNASLFQCATKFIGGALNYTKANINASIIDQCAVNETNALVRSYSAINAMLLNVVQLEFLATASELALCGNLTVDPNSFSAGLCLNTYTDVLNNLNGNMTAIGTMIAGVRTFIFGNSEDREADCFDMSIQNLTSIYAPMYTAYQNCTGTLATGVPSGFVGGPSQWELQPPEVDT